MRVWILIVGWDRISGFRALGFRVKKRPELVPDKNSLLQRPTMLEINLEASSFHPSSPKRVIQNLHPDQKALTPNRAHSV